MTDDASKREQKSGPATCDICASSSSSCMRADDDDDDVVA